MLLKKTFPWKTLSWAIQKSQISFHLQKKCKYFNKKIFRQQTTETLGWNEVPYTYYIKVPMKCDGKQMFYSGYSMLVGFQL